MNIKSLTKFVPAEAVVVFVPEETPSSYQKQLQKFLPESIFEALLVRHKKLDFMGKKNEVLQVFPEYKGIKKCFLVGMGKLEHREEIRRVAGTAIRAVKKAKATKASFVFLEPDWERVLFGALSGAYEFKLGDTKERVEIKTLTLCSPKKISVAGLAHEKSLIKAVLFTRDLVNFPGGHMTPLDLEKAAKKIAKMKNVSVKVLDKKQFLKKKMGGIMAVGQGASIAPRMIVLEYKKGKGDLTALVGKGVCFDSGGYNLKPTKYIETMFSDMAGAATVLGIFQWLATLQPEAHIVGVMGAVENMISGDAFRPGDIITMANGQTCEITNTDAEGRLVLADCLYYAVTQYKPKKIIDFATLTGACVAALGNEINGLMTNNKPLLNSIIKAANQRDELVWELPIIPLFREKIKSEVADLQNWTAGVQAGSSMGAAFLEPFVQETPWVHCDIAGTAFHETGDELAPKGATGSMVATMCAWFQAR